MIAPVGAVVAWVVATFALLSAQVAKAQSARRADDTKKAARTVVQRERAKAGRARARQRHGKKPRKPPKPGEPLRKDAPETKDEKAPIPTHRVPLESEKKKPEPVAKKEPAKKKKKREGLSPKDAAKQLHAYVTRMIDDGKSSALGTKDKRNAEIKRFQTAMQKISPDGIYGPKTRDRGKALTGLTFPLRRAAGAKPKPKTEAAPGPLQAPPAPAPPKPAPDDEPLLVSTAPAEPEEEEPETRSPKRAAQDLLLYLRSISTTGRAAALGYKDHPNETVRAAQADMRLLVDDGIYGPKTRARGKELTGQEFPAR